MDYLYHNRYKLTGKNSLLKSLLTSLRLMPILDIKHLTNNLLSSIDSCYHSTESPLINVSIHNQIVYKKFKKPTIFLIDTIDSMFLQMPLCL